MAGKKDPELKVLTRKEGVRPENPLFKAMGNDKYYRESELRTPELRAEADKLLPMSEYAGSSVDKSAGDAASRQTGTPATHDGEGNY
jgi:hypothetical protein